MSNNNESNNSGWIFLAGLATGAVVGYLINSDKGREVRAEAANKATEYGEQVRTVAQDKWSTAASTVNSIIEKGKAYAADVSAKLQSRINSTADAAEETVDRAENAFQQGANRAKANVNQLASKQ